MMVAPSNGADNKGGTVQERAKKTKEKISGLETQIDELRSSRCANWSGLEAVAQALGLVKDQTVLKPRRLLKGHFGKVYSADWAGSGNELVSASQDGKLIIWDAMLSTCILPLLLLDLPSLKLIILHI